MLDRFALVRLVGLAGVVGLVGLVGICGTGLEVGRCVRRYHRRRVIRVEGVPRLRPATKLRIALAVFREFRWAKVAKAFSREQPLPIFSRNAARFQHFKLINELRNAMYYGNYLDR